MASRIRELMARNLRRPRGLMGSLVTKIFFDKHLHLERNAARLCRIQPHHKILEVGFGPGHGLKEAYNFVKDGPGVVYGIDYSEMMLKTASRRLKREIQKGKVNLSYGSVTQLPYNTDMFDSVFHCNCYYFWPSMKIAVQELHRVMKPGSTMVTTLDLDRIRLAQERGLLKYGKSDPIRYMWALEEYGFEDVNFEYMADGERKFQVIFARINEKPAYNEDFEEVVASVGDLRGDKNKSNSVKVTGQTQPTIS